LHLINWLVGLVEGVIWFGWFVGRMVWLVCWSVGLVSLVGLVGLVGSVGLVGLVGLLLAV
jgi:hypothetical protein